MATKTSSIPRFLLPQFGPMWRSVAGRSAAFARPLNADVGQVMVRYVSQTASRRPAVASSAVANVAGVRAASKVAAKAAKAAPPTKLNKKIPTGTYAPKTAPAPTPAAAPSKPAAAAPKAKADPSKPLVLEKPERFNPPSHGARLPRSTPRHYGGSPTAEEVKAQSQKTYPGLPPPPNTWSSWFINNRAIHAFITLGTLTGLTIFTFVSNFKSTSPFADLIPPISEFPWHPFQYIGAVIDVVRMHEQYETEQTVEKRRRKAEDAAKRDEYRKAHGQEPMTGFLGAARAPLRPVEEKEKEGVVVTEPLLASKEAGGVAVAAASEGAVETPKKKWLGVW